MGNETPVLAGHPFPAESNVPWEGPKPAHHFVYKMRQTKNRNKRAKGLPPKSLVLFKQQETPPDGVMMTDDAALRAFARKIVADNRAYPEEGATSVHIPLREQCWVVIELERKTNWRFCTTHAAVTTKEKEQPIPGTALSGFNSELHYVYDNGDIVKDPWNQEPRNDDCHLVFFRMTHREPKQGCGMNFVVELYRERVPPKPGGAVSGIIPLIIDPQVPDIPPGGG